MFTDALAAAETKPEAAIAVKKGRRAGPMSRKLWPVETWRPDTRPNFLYTEGKTLVIPFDRLSDNILAFVRKAFSAMENPQIDGVVLDLRCNDGTTFFESLEGSTGDPRMLFCFSIRTMPS